MKKSWIVIPLVFALAGCGHRHQGPYGDHSVAWYKAHEPQAKQELVWCKTTHSASRSCEKILGPVAAYFAAQEQKHSFLGGAGNTAGQNLM